MRSVARRRNVLRTSRQQAENRRPSGLMPRRCASARRRSVTHRASITAGLPVLSFYTCGFGPLVRAFAGVAIDLTTPEESVAEFAAQINYLAAHPTVLSQISQAEIQNRSTLSWDSKARRMVEIYNDIVNKYSQTHHYED